MRSALIDAAIQLERDADADGRRLAERDRAIGLKMGDRPKRDAARMERWVEAAWVNPDASAKSDPEAARPGARISSALWSISGLLAIIGFILGAAVVSAVFLYDGSRPVNVTRVLWVLTGLPMILLVLTLPAMLPGGGLERFPPAAGLIHLATIVPAWLARKATWILPADARHAVMTTLDRAESDQRLLGAVRRWQLLRMAQATAIAYQLGVLAGFVLMVVVEDRAFGWSTTLSNTEDASRTFHRICQIIATPWSWLGERWAPSQVLVTDTGFTRYGADAAAFPTESSKAWWRFLLAGIVTYGLLPRGITWLWCLWQLRRATERAIVRLPGADAVLDRLNRPRVETGATKNSFSTATPSSHATDSTARPDRGGASATSQATPSGSAQPDAAAPPGPQVLINWGEAAWPGDHATPLQNVTITEHFKAGGGSDLTEDMAALRGAAALVERRKAKGVIVAVRGYEPPTVELIDLLTDLRAALGDGPRISVAPVPAARVTADWSRRVNELSDPWTELWLLGKPDTESDAQEASP